MNNVEAYNTNLGEGSPFQLLESFQDTGVMQTPGQTATPQTAQMGQPATPQTGQVAQPAGVAPTCQNGAMVGSDGLCPGTGESPQCAEGTTLDTASGMCMQDAADATPAVSCPEGQEPNEAGVCTQVMGNPAVAQQATNTTVATPTDVSNSTGDGAETPQCATPGHVWNAETQSCGPAVETFFGGNRLDMDLLLKALVFGCLFFILAHNDTRKMLVNASFLKSLKLRAGDDNSLLVLMGVFVICYIVLVRYVL